MDFLYLSVLALMGLATAYIALEDRAKILFLVSGMIWFILGLYILEENLLFAVCTLGVSLYLWLRLMVD